MPQIIRLIPQESDTSQWDAVRSCQIFDPTARKCRMQLEFDRIMLNLYLHTRHSLNHPFVIVPHSLPHIQLIENYQINCSQRRWMSES
jgi:hypothetical protein